jgi:hypothetical protein
MPIDDLHRDVAAIALRAASRHGFALAGGNAMIVHGMSTRPTEDVDLFTNRTKGVEAAQGAVEKALREAGYRVQREDNTAGLADIFPGVGEGLAEWIVAAPAGRQMRLQLAYFERERRPVIMEIGPVLDLEDVLAGKVAAGAARGYERDLIDIGSALERFSAVELIAKARKHDPALDDRDFAELGTRLDRLPDRAFTRYGLGPRQVAALRRRFVDWPRV